MYPNPANPQRFAGVLVAAAFLGACTGGDGPPETTASPSPPPTLSAEFSDIQANVFTPTCATAGCHIGAGAPQGLRLDEQNSYTLLVGITSSENPAVLRVAPGNPDTSYLIQKLEGTASAGAQMPLGGTPLNQAVIDVIRQWISDGAIDDRARATDPIRISSLSIVPDSVLMTAPTRIIAGFDREPDASTVNVNTFILEASGGDASFADGNETPISATSIVVPAGNPRTAIFDLSGTALADDTYRVRLIGAGASLILDLDANALDGEFSGAFPSGDGIAGGDFELRFAVMAATMGPTLDDIQASVFTPSCALSGCHTGPTSNNLPSGMDLSDADASFASLVGVASLQQPMILRVAANDPDSSYLVQKLEGTAATGGRMPAVGGPLSPALIAEVRQWIMNGAAR